MSLLERFHCIHIVAWILSSPVSILYPKYFVWLGHFHLIVHSLNLISCKNTIRAVAWYKTALYNSYDPYSNCVISLSATGLTTGDSPTLCVLYNSNKKELKTKLVEVQTLIIQNKLQYYHQLYNNNVHLCIYVCSLILYCCITYFRNKATRCWKLAPSGSSSPSSLYTRGLQ